MICNARPAPGVAPRRRRRGRGELHPGPMTDRPCISGRLGASSRRSSGVTGPQHDGRGMPASQQHVTVDTPMGATPVADGATFRVWAPRAAEVYLARGDTAAYRPVPQDALVCNPGTGHWTGFFPGVTDGSDLSLLRRRRGRIRRAEAGPAGGRAAVGRAARRLRLRRPRPRLTTPGTTPGSPGPRFLELVVYQFHVGCSSRQTRAGRDGGRARWRQLPRRAGPRCDLPRRPRGQRGPAAADRRVPVGERAWATTAPTCSLPRATTAVPRRRPRPYLARVNELLAARGQPARTAGQLGEPGKSAQGVRRHLPRVRPGRAVRRRLQPRRRRPR